VISEGEGKITFSVASPVAEEPTPKAEDPSAPSDDSAGIKENISSPEPDSTQEKYVPNATEESTDPPAPEKKKKKTPSTDPLRWFGVLVPPALRASQASFVSAVEGPIAALSNLLKELKQTEIEIGRVRKQIKKL
jgi:hypothetical protein